MIGTKRLLLWLTSFVLVCLVSTASAEMPEWRAVTQEDLRDAE